MNDKTEDMSLPMGWEMASLQEIAVPGGICNPQMGESSEFYYVDIEAVDNNSQKIIAPKLLPASEAPSRARMLIKAGDIIFSLVRPYLKNIAIVPNELDNQVASTAYCVLRPLSSITNSYIFYALLRENFIESIVTYGSSPPSGRDKEFWAMRIPLAPTNEQRRIVAAIEQQFSRLDAAVAALQQAREKLKLYRSAILKAAVEGSLTAEWREEHPATESATDLLKRILQERREKWEADQLAKMAARGVVPKDDKWKENYKEPAQPDTEDLQELPKGWRWINLGQITWSVKDGPHYSPEYVNDGIPFITGGNVRPTGIDFDNAKRITPELHNELSKRCKPEKGDILYTKGGTTGIARVNTYDIDFSVWVHVAVLKLINSINPFYVQHMLNSPFCYGQAQHFTHGVGNQDLGLTRMINIVLPLPPLAEQEQIVAIVEEQLSIISEMETTVEHSLKRAERERQSILREAFAGRLVPQDTDDEPASVLLARIQEERKRREQEEREKRVQNKQRKNAASKTMGNGRMEKGTDVAMQLQNVLWK